MSVNPQAAYLRCGRCGGNFGFIPQPGYARCPYCAFDQPVPRELIAELQRYAQVVQGELARADEAYLRAASWQQWAEQSQRAVPRLKLVIPAMSAFTLLGAAAFPISAELGLPPQQVGVIVTPLLVLPSLFLMGYLFWSYVGGGAAARRALAGHVAVACPNCGAKSELVAGAPGQVCSYCRTALIASRPVIERGIDAAELAHRRARLEEFRQERLGMVGLSRYDMSSFVPYFAAGSLLLPLGGGTLAFTFAMLTGEEPYQPAILLMWAMLLVVLAILLGTFFYRRARRAAFRQALSDLGRQFPLTPLADAAGVAAWLNRHWPAKYDVAHLWKGPQFVAASLEVYGYPALLHAEFSNDKSRKRRLHLLLAASEPRSNAPGSDARAVQAALARVAELGFLVTPTEAGLFARASEETVALVRKNPAALHHVAPAFTALARAAYSAGALPAPEL